ncbi:MAG: MBL fold metallo-hydrolase [Gorillibacterium sp.]|nr:MBL fold metallo-hydrolase [Gorillibacterium sp.]
MDELTILGNGDSMGVPRVYCDCAVCTEARTTGKNRRLRSALFIDTAEGSLWMDCGPDWVKQMEGAGRREMRQALLTHAHFDHMAGLPEWADACRWTKQKGILYAPQEVLSAVRERYPWLENQLIYQAVDGGLSFGGWQVTARKVCHGKNGFSYAYRFEKPNYSFVYCPDSINLNDEEKDFLKGLDLLVLGTSYYHEPFDFHTRSVYDMVEAMELLKEIRPARTLFTHMSHDVDVRRDYPLSLGAALAHRGTKIRLTR